MSYGAVILPLKKVVEISEILREKSIDRFMKKINDEDLQEYRDYQCSLVYYLQKLRDDNQAQTINT